MSAVNKALSAFQQILDDLGNEDHSVGMCDCEDRRALAAGLQEHAELVAALRAAQRLIDEALQKFDLGASTLDANAIRLLNETPGAVRAALAAAEEA